MNTKLDEQLAEPVHLMEHAFEYGDIDRTFASTYSDDIRFELGNIVS